MTESIAAQVAALPKKPTPELKQMWRELYDKEPPGFSRSYLISRLAYRITEREVTVLLADFATVWNELFPAEQARIVQLLVERVDVQEESLEVRIRAEGLASLVGELRQAERRAA